MQQGHGNFGTHVQKGKRRRAPRRARVHTARSGGVYQCKETDEPSAGREKGMNSLFFDLKIPTGVGNRIGYTPPQSYPPGGV